MLPIRLRDFVEDPDGWLYAVSTYDNEKDVGCLLRYVPDKEGGRTGPSGQRYRKYDFEDAYRKIAHEKPAYAGLVQRIPVGDLRRVLRPDQEISRIAASHSGVRKLLDLFRLLPGDYRLYRFAPVRAPERKFGYRHGRVREALVYCTGARETGYC